MVVDAVDVVEEVDTVPVAVPDPLLEVVEVPDAGRGQGISLIGRPWVAQRSARSICEEVSMEFTGQNGMTVT